MKMLGLGGKVASGWLVCRRQRKEKDSSLLLLLSLTLLLSEINNKILVQRAFGFCILFSLRVSNPLRYIHVYVDTYTEAHTLDAITSERMKCMREL